MTSFGRIAFTDGFITDDGSIRRFRHPVSVPVMIDIAVSHEDVGDVLPFGFRYQGGEPEEVQKQRTGVYRNLFLI